MPVPEIIRRHLLHYSKKPRLMSLRTCWANICQLDLLYTRTCLAKNLKQTLIFLPPKSPRFSLLVGYNIQPSVSSTNPNAALIIDRPLVGFYLQCIFLSSENKNLLTNSNSLHLCLLPFMLEPVQAKLGECRFSVAGFYCISFTFFFCHYSITATMYLFQYIPPSRVCVDMRVLYTVQSV